MPYWGSEAGWGSCGDWGFWTCQEAACELVECRVLTQMGEEDPCRKFRDLMKALMEPLGYFEGVMADLSDPYDLANATGNKLDVIGAVLDLPRQGFADDRYRDLLEIRKLTMLSAARNLFNRTGSINNILRIVRQFIGPGASPIIYTPAPPFGFKLQIPDVATSELDLLSAFLTLALDAGVLGYVEFELAEDSRWGSASVAVAQAGTWGSASVAVPDESTWGTVRLLGND